MESGSGGARGPGDRSSKAGESRPSSGRVTAPGTAPEATAGPDAPLVDSHCHLAFPEFDADRDAVVARARAAGVVGCVVVAVDAASAEAARALAAAQPGWAHPTAGIHPTQPQVTDAGEWERVRAALGSGPFVAVGETGLDAFHDCAPLDAQAASLHRHVRASLELALPLVVHCRDAFARLAQELAVYRGTPLKGVLHCFTGTQADLAVLLEAGLHVGVGGIATFKANAELRAAVRSVPDERLVLETDAPWLAPQAVRGRRNEPAFVGHVATCLAADRGMERGRFCALTTANARALFGLQPPPR